jgi:hypothetical protein
MARRRLFRRAGRRLRRGSGVTWRTWRPAAARVGRGPRWRGDIPCVFPVSIDGERKSGRLDECAAAVRHSRSDHARRTSANPPIASLRLGSRDRCDGPTRDIAMKKLEACCGTIYRMSPTPSLRLSSSTFGAVVEMKNTSSVIPASASPIPNRILGRAHRGVRTGIERQPQRRQTIPPVRRRVLVIEGLSRGPTGVDHPAACMFLDRVADLQPRRRAPPIVCRKQTPEARLQ